MTTSPRWGYKKAGKLGAAQRLHDQTLSTVNASQQQLKYLIKHHNIVPEGNAFTSDELKARAEAKAA